MKMRVDLTTFCEMFDRMDHSDSFSRAGLTTLYDYITYHEEVNGREEEFYVEDIVNNFIEYESIDEAARDFKMDPKEILTRYAVISIPSGGCIIGD